MNYKKPLTHASQTLFLFTVMTLVFPAGAWAYFQEAAANRGPVPTEYFGMQANSGVARQPPFWWSSPWPEVPIGSLRLWDAGVAWAQINTAPGVYDWTLLDDWLDDVRNFHVGQVLYTFGETPQWASSHPKDPICPWGPGECDPPKDLNPDGSGPDLIWQEYVAAIASHAAGRIKYWEVWNEPKNKYYWHGTVQQLVRMAKDARAVIRSIDPQAVMLSPSSHGPWQAHYFAAGGGLYADVIAYHGYTAHGGCIGFPQASDELLLIKNVRAVLKAYGQNEKPLWDTESSWGRTSATCFYNQDLQAAYLAQLFMLHWSAGVDRVFWYMYNNQLWGPLWTPSNSNPRHRNNKGTIRKAGVAYKQVYKWMVGMTMDGTCEQSGSTWTCHFIGANGYLAEAIWDTSETCADSICSTRRHAVSSEYTNYRTLDGSNIAITDGQVPIGAKPIWLEKPGYVPIADGP